MVSSMLPGMAVMSAVNHSAAGLSTASQYRADCCNSAELRPSQMKRSHAARACFWLLRHPSEALRAAGGCPSQCQSTIQNCGILPPLAQPRARTGTARSGRRQGVSRQRCCRREIPWSVSRKRTLSRPSCLECCCGSHRRQQSAGSCRCKVANRHRPSKPDRPKADEVGGSCSTGIECAKMQLSSTARKGAAQ